MYAPPAGFDEHGWLGGRGAKDRSLRFGASQPSAAAGRCLGAFIFHTGSPSTRVPSARRATEKRDRRRGRQDWIFEGVLFWRAAAYSTLGWLLALDGRPAEGLPYLASGAALQAEAGISGTLAVFWHRWAGGGARGWTAKGSRSYRTSCARARPGRRRGCIGAYMAEAFHVLGRIELESGNAVSARDRYQRARDLATSLEMRPLAARCDLGLGSVERRAADLTRARAYLARAAEEFRI